VGPPPTGETGTKQQYSWPPIANLRCDDVTNGGLEKQGDVSWRACLQVTVCTWSIFAWLASALQDCLDWAICCAIVEGLRG